MKGQYRLTLVILLLVVFTIVAFGTAGAEVGNAVINEFVANTTGTDTEFVEIFGDADTDHSTLTVIQIEGDSSSTPGEIKSAWLVGTTNASGHWRTDFMTNELENGTMTLLLVSGFDDNAVGKDIDSDDDGVIDIDPLPWTTRVDDVAVDDGGGGDITYSSSTLNRGFDGNSFTVGGASRIPDGVDTDTDDDWMRNDYDGAGLPGFGDGSPDEGEALNTPGENGAENEAYVAPPPPVEACGEDYMPIYEIQGEGTVSPEDGNEVSSEGVVIGALQGSSKLDGFYIQDPEGDDNPATSDGIFVYAPGSEPVEEGDAVRVRGTVDEYSYQTQIEEVVLILDCTELPGYEDWAVDPTEVSLPVADLDDWEMLESMLVTLIGELFVTDNWQLDYRGEAVLSAGDINQTPTNIAAPGAPAAIVAEANALKSIILDDGSTETPAWDQFNPVPYTGDEGTLRIGDHISGTTAVLTDNYYGVRLQPTTDYDIDFTHIPRPMAPDEVGGTIKVATFNVLNFWTTWCDEYECRGAEDKDQFEIQSEKLAQAIHTLDADIIGLQELENHFVDDLTENDDEAIQVLVEILNDTDSEVDDVWSYVPTPSNPRDYDNNYAIINGIIYRHDRVTAVEGKSWWLDDPAFNAPKPGTDVSIARAPIAQTFDAKGEVFTVVSNHFKSKSCSGVDEDGVLEGDVDSGDGQACWNQTRTLEALALLDFVDMLKSEPYGDDDDVIVLGDYNSYAKEDPIQVLNSGLLNQMSEFLDDEEQVTYVFDGGNGALDHIFTTSEMESIPTAVTETPRITGLDIWHVNHDEPYGFAYYLNPQLITNPEQQMFRSSDHDPVVMGFCDAVAPVVTVTATPDWIWPPNHRYHEIVITVSATDNFDSNPTIWHEDDWYMSNEPDNGTGDGNTTDDMLFVSEDEGGSVFKVRAERAGNGDGRTYTFTYRATDSCGNVGTGDAIVYVPHDMGKDKDKGDRNDH